MKFEITSAGIKEIIAQGESDTVEFKAKLPPDPLAAKILTAFSNFRGGILLIGVGDNGEVLGLTKGSAIEAISRLKNLTSSLFAWPVDVHYVDVDNKRIVYVVIDEAPPHLAPIMTSAGEFYTRRNGQLIRLEQSVVLAPHHGKGSSTIFPDKPCVVFVAMSFRVEEEPSLVDYYRAMERALERTKLPMKLLRIDLVEGDYEISQRLIDEIDKADIVITDFTLIPANVYFELGYSRGRGKRVIQKARKGTTLEFDIRNWRTIFYKNATELEERLISELQSAYAEISQNK